jgi:hypothetical protein
MLTSRIFRPQLLATISSLGSLRRHLHSHGPWRIHKAFARRLSLVLQTRFPRLLLAPVRLTNTTSTRFSAKDSTPSPTEDGQALSNLYLALSKIYAYFGHVRFAFHRQQPASYSTSPTHQLRIKIADLHHHHVSSNELVQLECNSVDTCVFHHKGQHHKGGV